MTPSAIATLASIIYVFTIFWSVIILHTVIGFSSTYTSVFANFRWIYPNPFLKLFFKSWSTMSILFFFSKNFPLKIQFLSIYLYWLFKIFFLDKFYYFSSVIFIFLYITIIYMYFLILKYNINFLYNIIRNKERLLYMDKCRIYTSTLINSKYSKIWNIEQKFELVRNTKKGFSLK